MDIISICFLVGEKISLFTDLFFLSWSSWKIFLSKVGCWERDSVQAASFLSYLSDFQKEGPTQMAECLLKVFGNLLIISVIEVATRI